MPEMQLFGLPDKIINTGTKIATISYLKAEDANGNLHDILGRHQWLPFTSASWYQTRFRFYLGDIANIDLNDQILHLDIHPENASVQPCNMGIDGKGCYETWIGFNCETGIFYYELYIHSADNEKIMLSSGYIGGLP